MVCTQHQSRHKVIFITDGDYSASFTPVTSADECIPVLESFIRASSGGHPPIQKPVNLHVQLVSLFHVINSIFSNF